MSESGDYSPGVWAGYDFTAARQQYDVHVGRSYTEAQSGNKRASDLIPVVLETASPTPVIICCDVTGSMGSWPATIFSKLPYLDNECKEYLGPEAEVCFAANGDLSDSYPLQIRPFAKGRDMETQLKELVIEGGGSGPEYVHECYEMAALYFARNVKMPNTQRKPILIFIADEHFHQTLDKGFAKLAYVDIESTMNSSAIFEELTEKYSVYLIRKPYSGHDADIVRQWKTVLGEDRIVELPGPERVVDVIFGILAKETNKVDYFKQEIEERQRPDQVATVYKSLETIHLLSDQGTEGKSIMHTALKGKLTKRLLP
jgi:hypothetical protein